MAKVKTRLTTHRAASCRLLVRGRQLYTGPNKFMSKSIKYCRLRTCLPLTLWWIFIGGFFETSEMRSVWTDVGPPHLPACQKCPLRLILQRMNVCLQSIPTGRMQFGPAIFKLKIRYAYCITEMLITWMLSAALTRELVAPVTLFVEGYLQGQWRLTILTGCAIQH